MDSDVHLPDGVAVEDVRLDEGGSLPGAWTAAWEQDPGRTVLATPAGRSLTAAELAERTASAAGRYAAAGLQPGDRLLLAARSSPDVVVAYVGALRAGLTVVPTNPAYTGAELERLRVASEPKLAVLDEPARFGDAGRTGCRTTGPDLAQLPTPQGVRLDQAAPTDSALLVFTSGSTGTPKGALLSHANLLASAHAVRLAWRWTPQDRLALCLPLFHVHGLGVGLHGTLLAGASAVLLPGFDPGAVASAVRDQHATMFFGVPTMYHRLAASPHLADLRHLRLAVSGSAPLPAQLHEAIGAGSNLRVLERYGMTETMMLVSNPYAGERRPGTVGFPLPGVELRLAGELGEIEVRGPNVCSGYLGGVGADAFCDDGWFRTGDLGAYDSDGYLRISGRAKELIITGGFNVHPREVEDVLAAHPGVRDVAVAGVPDREWGEVVAAYVVGDPAGLEQWCAERLVAYKRPRLWQTVEAIPRTALGKVERHRLAGVDPSSSP